MENIHVKSEVPDDMTLSPPEDILERLEMFSSGPPPIKQEVPEISKPIEGGQVSQLQTKKETGIAALNVESKMVQSTAADVERVIGLNSFSKGCVADSPSRHSDRSKQVKKIQLPTSRKRSFWNKEWATEDISKKRAVNQGGGSKTKQIVERKNSNSFCPIQFGQCTLRRIATKTNSTKTGEAYVPCRGLDMFCPKTMNPSTVLLVLLPCPGNEQSSSSLPVQLNQENESKLKKSNDTSNSVTKKFSRCDLCHQLPADPKSHVKASKNCRIFQCRFCTKYFQRRSSVEHHLKQHGMLLGILFTKIKKECHEKKMTWFCNQCEAHFFSLNVLVSHLNAEHGNGNDISESCKDSLFMVYQCTRCNAFMNKDSVLAHVGSHNDQVPAAVRPLSISEKDGMMICPACFYCCCSLHNLIFHMIQKHKGKIPRRPSTS